MRSLTTISGICHSKQFNTFIHFFSFSIFLLNIYLFFTFFNNLSKNSIINETKKSKNKNRKNKKNKEINDSSVQQIDHSNDGQMCCSDSSCLASHASNQLGEADGAIGGHTSEESGEPNEVNAWTYNKLQDIKKAVEMLNLYQGSGAAKTPEEALKKKYEFWETQPVPKLDENPDVNDAIEANKNREQIKKDSLNLPIGFVWDTLDINDDNIVRLFEFFLFIN